MKFIYRRPVHKRQATTFFHSTDTGSEQYLSIYLPFIKQTHLENENHLSSLSDDWLDPVRPRTRNRRWVLRDGNRHRRFQLFRHF
ncbi:hypothetical protein ScPMuIL_006770 [Solemya velum]